jgi:transcriptional regulator with XRE-family HTH domain
MDAMLTDDDVKANLSENLARLLADRGWSQSELARRTTDHVMTISRICRGQNAPTAGVLARIAEALDVSIDRLVSQPPMPSRQSA